MGYINSNTAPSIIQLADDTLGKMFNKYIELVYAGGAYEPLENKIIIISVYLSTAAQNQSVANSSDIYQTMINNLYNLVSLQEYTPFTYGSPITEGFVYTKNQTSIIYDGFTSVTSYTPNRFIVSNKFGYPVTSNLSIDSFGIILQTDVVFPTEGLNFYTFAELIGQTVMTVYRGTGTILRARSSAPSNEFAQFDGITGRITVNYAFSAGESLWVEYKTTI